MTSRVCAAPAVAPGGTALLCELAPHPTGQHQRTIVEGLWICSESRTHREDAEDDVRDGAARACRHGDGDGDCVGRQICERRPHTYRWGPASSPLAVHRRRAENGLAETAEATGGKSSTGPRADQESVARPEPERKTLGSSGQIYVTLTAATTYAEARRLRPEEARRELTELLLGATLRTDGSWRVRSRATGIDVSARILHEGALLVVVSLSARRAS
jgi:hypothetical protein